MQQSTQQKPITFGDILSLITPKRVAKSKRTPSAIAKDNIILDLQKSTLNDNAKKDVFYQGTVYNVKKIVLIDKVIFQLIDLKYKHVSIQLEFKNKENENHKQLTLPL